MLVLFLALSLKSGGRSAVRSKWAKYVWRFPHISKFLLASTRDEGKVVSERHIFFFPQLMRTWLGISFAASIVNMSYESVGDRDWAAAFTWITKLS